MASDAIKTDGARMIREIVDVIAARDRGIAAANLFGSQASDRARADSGVDLAVLYAHPPEVSTRNMYFDLEPILRRCRRVG